MAPLYTKQLWSNGNFGGPGGFFGPGPPDGTIWVIRDCVCVNIFYAGLVPLHGFNIFGSSSEVVVFYRQGWGVYGSTTYDWNGRVVMLPGDALFFEDNDGGWEWVISGYELTAP